MLDSSSVEFGNWIKLKGANKNRSSEKSETRFREDREKEVIDRGARKQVSIANTTAQVLSSAIAIAKSGKNIEPPRSKTSVGLYLTR